MAAQKYIVNGVIFEDDESGDKVIVAGRVLETLPTPAAGAPTLSLPTYTNVTADSATVGCTVTF